MGAGTTTGYCFGDDVSQLGEYAWYKDNSEKTTHPIGELKPNAGGIFDMHGNVWEWCQDWHGPYESLQVASDPTGPASGQNGVAGRSTIIQRTSALPTASASRTQSSYLTPILSLKLVQRRGGGQSTVCRFCDIAKNPFPASGRTGFSHLIWSKFRGGRHHASNTS